VNQDDVGWKYKNGFWKMACVMRICKAEICSLHRWLFYFGHRLWRYQQSFLFSVCAPVASVFSSHLKDILNRDEKCKRKYRHRK